MFPGHQLPPLSSTDVPDAVQGFAQAATGLGWTVSTDHDEITNDEVLSLPFWCSYWFAARTPMEEAAMTPPWLTTKKVHIIRRARLFSWRDVPHWNPRAHKMDVPSKRRRFLSYPDGDRDTWSYAHRLFSLCWPEYQERIPASLLARIQAIRIRPDYCVVGIEATGHRPETKLPQDFNLPPDLYIHGDCCAWQTGRHSTAARASKR